MELSTPTEALSTRWRAEAEAPPGTGWTRYALTDEGTELGLVALRESGATATLGTLWLAPEHRDPDLDRRGLAAVEEHCRGRGVQRLISTTTPHSPQRHLFDDWKISSRRMELTVTEDPALPAGVTADRLTPEAYPAWRDYSAREYAVDIAKGQDISIAEAVAQAQQQFDELLPQGLDTPDNELWNLNLDDGTKVAFLWVHIDHGKGHVFIYDVESDAAHRGKGYGRAATRLAESRALAAGLDRVWLHVFDDNVAANRLYTSLGYQVIHENCHRQL